MTSKEPIDLILVIAIRSDPLYWSKKDETQKSGLGEGSDDKPV